MDVLLVSVSTWDKDKVGFNVFQTYLILVAIMSLQQQRHIFSPDQKTNTEVIKGGFTFS